MYYYSNKFDIVILILNWEFNITKSIVGYVWVMPKCT